MILFERKIVWFLKHNCGYGEKSRQFYSQKGLFWSRNGDFEQTLIHSCCKIIVIDLFARVHYYEIMLFQRSVEKHLLEYLHPGKVVVLYGARRVGKTTLIHDLTKSMSLKTRFINAEDKRYYQVLGEPRADQLSAFIGDNDLLVIDEAQHIPGIGASLKLIVDQLPDKRLLISGSSSLSLAKQIGEPLTGRSWTFQLHPISLSEYGATIGQFEAEQSLGQLLVYGMYPDVLTTIGTQGKEAYLNELINAYLYRDLLEFGLVQKPPAVRKLLELLAFQVGSLVSLAELGQQVGLDRVTVERYLGLLEDSFVIFRLGGYSRNLRNEISKTAKYYFWDVGVRNALISRYQPLSLRDDIGALWENFCIVERRKTAVQPGTMYRDYFWRTHTGSEIDYIEEQAGQLRGTEFKWNPRKTPRTPKKWLEAYPHANFTVITPANLSTWLN